MVALVRSFGFVVVVVFGFSAYLFWFWWVCLFVETVPLVLLRFLSLSLFLPPPLFLHYSVAQDSFKIMAVLLPQFPKSEVISMKYGLHYAQMRQGPFM